MMASRLVYFVLWVYMVAMAGFAHGYWVAALPIKTWVKCVLAFLIIPVQIAMCIHFGI
jgi:hypothetical protein